MITVTGDEEKIAKSLAIAFNRLLEEKPKNYYSLLLKDRSGKTVKGMLVKESQVSIQTMEECNFSSGCGLIEHVVGAIVDMKREMIPSFDHSVLLLLGTGEKVRCTVVNHG